MLAPIPADYHVVEIKQTKCVGCGKWIENMDRIAYFNSEWEARGYCSAECREKNPNAEAEKIELCSDCKKTRSYCKRTITVDCIECVKQYQKTATCPAVHYNFPAGVEGKCPTCVSSWMSRENKHKTETSRSFSDD